MTRLPNWAASLDSFLTASERRKFQYGTWDCCLFVCDCIRVMTGTDPASRFRGKYGSRDGAMREVAEYCGAKSVQAVTERICSDHSMPEVKVSAARRGDVVLIKRGRDYSLGIVALNGRDAVITSGRGLWRIPLSRATRAWSV